LVRFYVYPVDKLCGTSNYMYMFQYKISLNGIRMLPEKGDSILHRIVLLP